MYKLINYIKITVIILFGLLCSVQLEALTFCVKYSKSIDLLNFMDKLSDWESGPVAEEYKLFWDKNNYKSQHDQKHLLAFKEVRKKYYFRDSSNIFAQNNYNQDVISRAFYTYDEPKKALLNLKSNISYLDFIKFQKSINYFSERITKVIAGQSHRKAIKNLNEILDKDEIQAYIKQICNFYNVDFDKLHINIAFNHTLEDVDETAFMNLDTIVLSDFTYKKNIYINEEKYDFFQTIDNASILMHEIAHLISSNASTEQKENLTKVFESNFNLPQNVTLQKKLYLLEEPLAVILGQILFTRKIAPEYYIKSQNWYADSWVNTIAKLKEKTVARYLEENKSVDDKLVKSFARESNELLNISKSIIN